MNVPGAYQFDPVVLLIVAGDPPILSQAFSRRHDRIGVPLDFPLLDLLGQRYSFLPHIFRLLSRVYRHILPHNLLARILVVMKRIDGQVPGTVSADINVFLAISISTDGIEPSHSRIEGIGHVILPRIAGNHVVPAAVHIHHHSGIGPAVKIAVLDPGMLRAPELDLLSDDVAIFQHAVGYAAFKQRNISSFGIEHTVDNFKPTGPHIFLHQVSPASFLGRRHAFISFFHPREPRRFWRL